MAGMNTPLRLFKTYLIEGWPDRWVRDIAIMAMIDSGLTPPADKKFGFSFETIDAFVHSLHMFSSSVSVLRYIAKNYPRTNEALFSGNGKDAALKIFLREKKRPQANKVKLFNSAKETRQERANVFVKARSLSKWHDWNTVK